MLYEDYAGIIITSQNKTWVWKCPKILYTKVSDKMEYANSADPDQTAPD